MILNNDSPNLGLSYLSHLSLLCSARLPTVDWLGRSPLITSFSPFYRPDSPCYAAGIELSPAAASPNLLFEELYCCHLSLAHKCTLACTYTHTCMLA